jgi:hypothetical protein
LKNIRLEKVLLILSSVLLFYLACATVTQQTLFKYDNAVENSVSLKTLSPQKIDGAATHEIYFKLETPVRCILVSVASAYRETGLKKNIKNVNAYFVVEKLMDVSKFNDVKGRYIPSIIGKNFDAAWERKQEVSICSDEGDPIKILDSKSIYKIRFTTFTDYNVEYAVNIRADCKISFFNKMPQ